MTKERTARTEAFSTVTDVVHWYWAQLKAGTFDQPTVRDETGAQIVRRNPEMAPLFAWFKREGESTLIRWLVDRDRVNEQFANDQNPSVARTLAVLDGDEGKLRSLLAYLRRQCPSHASLWPGMSDQGFSDETDEASNTVRSTFVNSVVSGDRNVFIDGGIGGVIIRGGDGGMNASGGDINITAGSAGSSANAADQLKRNRLEIIVDWLLSHLWIAIPVLLLLILGWVFGFVNDGFDILANLFGKSR